MTEISDNKLKDYFYWLDHLPIEKRPENFPSLFIAHRMLSQFVWDIYGHNASVFYAKHHPGQHSTLAEKGMVTGQLDENHAQLLKTIFESCTKQELDPFDFPVGYFHEPRDFVHVNMRRINHYFSPSDFFYQHMPSILRPMISRIEQECGFYWRIASFRIFAVKPVESTQDLHLDEWSPSIKKLFYYPNGVSKDLGSTEIVTKQGEKVIVEGGAGTWLLFENSLAYHQAFSTVNAAIRPTIEFDLVPALSTDATLRYAGVNGWFPYFPFETEGSNINLNSREINYDEVYERTLKRVAGLMTLYPHNHYYAKYDLLDLPFDEKFFSSSPEPSNIVETAPIPISHNPTLKEELHRLIKQYGIKKFVIQILKSSVNYITK